MSSNKITGKEYPLYDIFSSDFDYYIPAYQRPYAWSEEETETLYDDLYSFFTTEKTENYFLGSIVLIKDDNNPRADVIDGQQRLTTLTILFAAIASKLPENVRGTFMTYLLERETCSKDLMQSQGYICVKEIASSLRPIFKMCVLTI